MKKILYEEVSTVSGLSGDVVISAMQKFIRRGMIHEAAQAAYELCLCGEELAEYTWKRLLVISAEDIGLGQPLAACVVGRLYETGKVLGYRNDDYPMIMIHAVRYLCTCPKERGSVNLTSLIKRKIARGDQLECPDWTYDMHTAQGQNMGRGYDHFFDEAANVYPKAQVEDHHWEEELRNMMKEGY